jgi:type II secretory pathway pseudopilin PulG
MKRARQDAGFALAALICMLTAAAVLTAVVIPLRVMQTRRETEQELIFRGQEYIRAIQKYQRKYGGAYPSSVEDLISRDGFRFLRKQYLDPVTGRSFG